MRNFAFPGRSPVYGTRAMCATSHPLATVAALGFKSRDSAEDPEQLSVVLELP